MIFVVRFVITNNLFKGTGMKLQIFAMGLAAILVNESLFACDIVNKRNVTSGTNKGVAGVCSNNGKEIECYDVGEYQGGITCSGPEGSNSGYVLQNLIYSVCGCHFYEEGAGSPEEQIDQKLQ